MGPSHARHVPRPEQPHALHNQLPQGENARKLVSLGKSSIAQNAIKLGYCDIFNFISETELITHYEIT